MGSTKLEHGDRVKILSPPNSTCSTAAAFAGKTGRVLYDEKIGGDRYYTIKLDQAVMIDGIGPVTSDMWMRSHLRKLAG